MPSPQQLVAPTRVTFSALALLFFALVGPLRALPTFPFYPQVPLTARERPSHGVHRRSVFQAKVQSAAQVSTFTLPASRPRTEAHLPSPGGENEAALVL